MNIKYPFDNLTSVLEGVKPGQIYVLFAGRRSGKSALHKNLNENKIKGEDDE